MSDLVLGSTTVLSDSSGTPKLSSSVFPAGTIIQTQFTQVTTISTQTYSADTDTAINGLSVNITPLFNNSIFKLECYFMLEYEGANEMNGSVGFFFRNSTA